MPSVLPVQAISRGGSTRWIVEVIDAAEDFHSSLPSTAGRARALLPSHFDEDAATVLRARDPA
jgi:hypothetical protein